MSDVRETLEAAYEELASTEGHTLPEPEVMIDDVAVPKETASEGRNRDEQGRFAPKDSNEVATNGLRAEGSAPADTAKPVDAPAAKQGEETPPETPPADGADRTAAPPPRLGTATKAAWNDLPEAIRKEIWDREDKMDRGMARYAGLADYAVEAEKNGRSLKEVMAAYTAAEERLVNDPIATIADFCRMTNTNPLAVAQILGVPVGQSPMPPQSAPQGASFGNPDPRVDELLRWKQELAAREAAREAERVNSEVNSFLSDTKRFPYAENVRVTMGRLLETGMASTLEDAYQQAIYLDPYVRKLVEEQNFKARMSTIQQQQSVQSARAAVQSAKQSSGSVTGAPMAGGRSSSNSSGPKSVAETLREAYDSLAG